MNKEEMLDTLNDIIKMIETDCKLTGQFKMTPESKKYAYNIRLDLVDLYEDMNK